LINWALSRPRRSKPRPSPLLAGKDIVGQSQTGSGKTAAFGIPAVEKVDPNIRAVQVLILCPTRELAIQVSEEIHKLALFKRGINALPIYGGQSYERQFDGLKQGAQIVIGTPGASWITCAAARCASTI
jgi:ATP-dependent RNA helicase DeaD